MSNLSEKPAQGMTYREHVAAVVMASMLSNMDWYVKFDLLARDAVEAADALIAELEKPVAKEKEETKGPRCTVCGSQLEPTPDPAMNALGWLMCKRCKNGDGHWFLFNCGDSKPVEAR